jgi:hypothetical protein
MKIKPQKDGVGKRQEPVYIRNGTIVERRIGETVFLVNPETDIIYQLNPLGTAIWRFLEGSASAEETVAVVRLAFPDIPAIRITEDVHRLLRELFRKNLTLTNS